MEAQKTLGNNIVFTRKTYGLNQQELAELAHVSSKTLRKIERGEFDDIFGDTVKKVCYALYEYSKTGSASAKYWGTPSWLKEYITSSIPDGYYCATLETVSDTSNTEVLKDILKKLDDISQQLAEVLESMSKTEEIDAAKWSEELRKRCFY